jgi:hypothetical protein
MKIEKFILVLIFLFSALAFAGQQQKQKDPFWHNMYFGVEGGFSMSTEMNFVPDYDTGAQKVWLLPNGGGDAFKVSFGV